MKKRIFGLAGCRSTTFIAALVLCIGCFSSMAMAQYGYYGMSGDINFLMGQKELEADDWEPLDEQLEFGIDFDCKMPLWPISLAFGLLSSYDDDHWSGWDVEGRTMEFYGGVRKIFMENQQIRPYIGAGLNMIYAEVDYDFESYDDSDLGFWLGGGMYITLQRHLNLGINILYSDAEVDLNGYEGEAGGLHYHFLIGYHW